MSTYIELEGRDIAIWTDHELEGELEFLNYESRRMARGHESEVIKKINEITTEINRRSKTAQPTNPQPKDLP